MISSSIPAFPAILLHPGTKSCKYFILSLIFSLLTCNKHTTFPFKLEQTLQLKKVVNLLYSLFQLSYDYQWLDHDVLVHEWNQSFDFEPQTLWNSSYQHKFPSCFCLRWSTLQSYSSFAPWFWIPLPRQHFLWSSYFPKQPKQN